MKHNLSALFALLLLPVVAVAAGDEEPRALSGISIIGNDEAPKSLYIVPWKASRVGDAAEFGSTLLDDGLMPVDKEVFMRELRFYELSNP
jgi:hypothetical protein